MARHILLIAAFLTLFMFIGIECAINRHVTVTHRNACHNRECYESGHGSNSDGYEAVCCSSGDQCYRVISTGQMGCFTLTDKVQSYGCIYECENPDDCKIEIIHIGMCHPWRMQTTPQEEIYVFAKVIIATPFGSPVGKNLALQLGL